MTDATLARRSLALFDELLDVPEHEREAWISDHATSDELLANELRALVAAAAMGNRVLETAHQAVTPAQLRESLASALRDRYVIDSELGRGGMAAVFLARERKHDRDVVIKVLDPNTTQHFGAERFLQEVRIAATLAHPHIVPLIDSGNAHGFLYYVMPYMSGESLRTRVRRSALSTAESLQILRDVADALVFAHDAGVVHRDIKPENVFLTPGHAYLLDFGIAKLANDSATDNITLPGLALGTRRYMAPEQVQASENIDARTDIFAWGLLGIELLTGEIGAASATKENAPAAVRRIAQLHPDIATLLLECVAGEPQQRPQSMADVIPRLDAVVSAILAPARNVRKRRLHLAAGLAATALIAVAVRAQYMVADDATAPIAVSVFRNETGDSAQSVVGRFAGDWVTQGLQRMGNVRVVPWSESRVASEHAIAAGAPVASTVRNETGAGVVVTGSYYALRERRDSLVLHAQLVYPRSGLVTPLPEIVFAVSSPDQGISELRDRVMGAVAAAHDKRVAPLPGLAQNPPSFPAYRLFDQGLDRFLAQEYAQSLPIFRDAFAHDTTFTAALLLGARAAFNDDNLAVAETLVVQARLRESEMSPYQNESLLYIESLMHGDGEKARAAIQRAADIAPNSRAGFDNAAALLNAGYARAAKVQLQRMDPDRGEMMGWSSYWTQLAHAENMLNHHEAERQAAREMARRYPDRRVALVLEARALAAIGDLRRLDSALTAWEPLPSDVYWSQGAAMVVASEELTRRGNPKDGRRYAERAVSWFAARLVAVPNDRAHRYWLGSALYELDRFEEARVHFEALATEYPTRMRYRGLAALTAARRGDTTAANKWLGTSTPRDHGEFLAYQARLAAIAGNTESAIALLTSALDCGVDAYPWWPALAFHDLEPIVKDPRGRALLTGR
ncbi:MAG: protein kinase [Gemmatimonas sp.]